MVARDSLSVIKFKKTFIFYVKSTATLFVEGLSSLLKKNTKNLGLIATLIPTYDLVRRVHSADSVVIIMKLSTRLRRI